MNISPKKFLIERLRRIYKLRFLHKLSLYSVIASHLDNSRYRGYNWWDEYASLFWLPRFIDLYFEPKKKINLFSSFRKPLRFIRHYKGVNIFLSGENLANYRFNLCPENSLGEGYITEKIFDSIRSGCIPIYWGAYLEPGILNPRAILRFEEGKEQESYDRVKELWEDEEAYEQFILEPPFVEGAAERIWGILEGLRERLRPLVG